MPHRWSRRHLVQGAGAVGLGLLAGCGRLSLPGQQAAKVPRVGLLAVGSREGRAPLTTAFLEGLQELGYVEGQNVAIELRFAEESAGLLPQFATELVRLPVDVLVAAGGRPTEAAIRATTTIPVVLVNVNDPVAAGFVASLARPGGNVTGLSNLVSGVSAKRLELLHTVVPELREIAVLWNPTNPVGDGDLRQAQAAGQALGLRLHPLEVRGREDFETAFQRLAAGPDQALFLLGDPLMYVYRTEIADFALRHRLPTGGGAPEFAEAGGLMGYGSNASAVYRRAAYYVDRILKGTQPADLPVEQPMRFDFVINLKTAQALGLTIPQHVLLQTTEVIQ
jgi:putative tryptophan/tyrosine transport system substrate-binding protein